MNCWPHSCETNQINLIPDRRYGLTLWPHTWPWPWILRAQFEIASGMETPTNKQRKGCESIIHDNHRDLWVTMVEWVDLVDNDFLIIYIYITIKCCHSYLFAHFTHPITLGFFTRNVTWFHDLCGSPKLGRHRRWGYWLSRIHRWQRPVTSKNGHMNGPLCAPHYKSMFIYCTRVFNEASTNFNPPVFDKTIFQVV